MNKIFSKLGILVTVIFLFSSCETFDLEEGLVDPNNPPLDQAGVEFLLNNVQVGFGDSQITPGFFFNLSEMGMEITRMKAMGGDQYDIQFGPNYFRSARAWAAYSDYLTDIQTIKGVAAANPDQDNNYALGLAKTIEAYTITTLVDFYGNVPYSEALLGVDNLNPSLDQGADVYAAAQTLLDEAEGHFNVAASFNGADLFYGGMDGAVSDVEETSARWIKVINTLRLKLAIQTRLVDGSAQATITQLLSEDLINSSDDNFVFRYGTSTANPDNRHTSFTTNYGVGAADYMSNDFMQSMLNGVNNVEDPRLRFYFYRQVSEVSNTNQDLPCVLNNRPANYPADEAFCFLPDGYWGRDHLDSDGIPPDGTSRTVFGVYPVGGKFDNNDFTSTTTTDGLQGAGFEPILMDFFVDFYRVEAALVYGIGDAASSLEAAVRGSVETVFDFGAAAVPSGSTNVPEQVDIDGYITTVISEFNSLATNDEKLDFAMEQFRIAAFGNGIEIYNAYRRTGYPTGLQPGLSPDTGIFPRSLFYPADSEVITNTNIDQKANVAEQVFWDTNPAGFID